MGNASDPGRDRALDGIEIVSLAQNIPGPVALSMPVADGAGATKIEPPAGDMLGHAAPDSYAETTRDCSIRKIDLRNEGGRAELRELLVSADLLLTSQRPSALARLGVLGDALAALNPELCWVEIVGDTDAPEVPGHDLTYSTGVRITGTACDAAHFNRRSGGGARRAARRWHSYSAGRGAAPYGIVGLVSGKPPNPSQRPWTTA